LIDDKAFKTAKPEVAKNTRNRRADDRELRHLCLPEYSSTSPVYLTETAYHYCNTGYIIVGAILEKVSGKHWDILMREMLFEPLDMQSAGFNAQAAGDDQPLSEFLGMRERPRPPSQPWAHESPWQSCLSRQSPFSRSCGERSLFFRGLGEVCAFTYRGQ
jgi:CubicO group peptidase (beta-lactamase class C family)